jgi:hypothetical protein
VRGGRARAQLSRAIDAQISSAGYLQARPLAEGIKVPHDPRCVHSPVYEDVVCARLSFIEKASESMSIVFEFWCT